MALFLVLLVKHAVCDGWLQLNDKRLHAVAHAYATLLVLLAMTPDVPLAITLALCDGALHYRIDRLKGSVLALFPRHLMLVTLCDQALHVATYVWIWWVLTR